MKSRIFVKLIVAISIIWCISLISTNNSYAAKQSEDNINENVITEWQESEETISVDKQDLNALTIQESNSNSFSIQQKTDKNQINIFHNNGEPINTNIASDTEQKLYAVAEYDLDGTNYRTYYFSDNVTEEENIEEVKQDILEQVELNLLNPKKINSEMGILAAKGTGHYIREYNWTFKDSNGRTKSKLRTNVELERASSRVNINGKQGSVWDIHTFSTWERSMSGHRLSAFYTRLAVPYTNQSLIRYGPTSSTVSGSTASVGLSGYVPSVSWSFGIGGYSMEDLSSVSQKYGRWKFKTNLLNLDTKKLVTEPGIRASNTSGNFGLQLSHTTEGNLSPSQHNTGVISIYVSDR